MEAKTPAPPCNKSRKVSTLVDLWQKRLELSAPAPAYRAFNQREHRWETFSWGEMGEWVERYKKAFAACHAQAGDRVAVMLGNSPHWVACDQAILASGCVSVPLFSEDNAGNCDYILRDSGARVAVVGQRQLKKMRPLAERLPRLTLICVERLNDNERSEKINDLEGWLSGEREAAQTVEVSAEDLATIVYTSGTTGPPKGAMLSHRNIVSNVFSILQSFPIEEGMLYISFLPLSHTFERTASYYLAVLTGAQIAFARSSVSLMEDMRHHRPNVIMSVPLVYEKIYQGMHARLSEKSAAVKLLFHLALRIGWQRRQHPWLAVPYAPLWCVLDKLIAKPLRDSLGGRIRWAVSGGAASSG